MNTFTIPSTVEVRVVVGYCEKGGYIIVPKTLFGTDTFILNENERLDYRLLGVLEDVISKRTITAKELDNFNTSPFHHVVNHPNNGKHIIHYHYMTFGIYMRVMDSKTKQQYELIDQYIKLRKEKHEAKMYLKSLSDQNLSDEYKRTFSRKYKQILEEYIEARKNAKAICGNITRFEAMIRFYWQRENS